MAKRASAAVATAAPQVFEEDAAPGARILARPDHLRDLAERERVEPIDPARSDAKAQLLARFPQVGVPYMRPASDRAHALATLYIDYSDQAERIAREKEIVANELRAEIGNHLGVEDDLYAITWNDSAGATDYAAIVRALRVEQEVIDAHKREATRTLRVARKRGA